MKQIVFKSLVLLLLPMSITLALGPGSCEAVEDEGTFSFYFENDLFADTDYGYTNGVKLSWISPDLTGYARSDSLPDWSLPVIRRLPFINEQGLQRNVGLSIGQNMYTPGDISIDDLIEDDRPYAGWTYFGIGLHSKNERRLDSMEIQLGIVGPYSFAEHTQKLVHKLRGCQTPNGWDNQIKNEPGLAVVYERKWRSFYSRGGGLGLDLIPRLGGALGNVYTYANAGIEARIGWNIPRDFGTSLIRPAGDSNAPLNTRDPRLSGSQDFSLYVFTMVDGRAVLRNIFLDGNTFTDSHNVDKKYFVGDVGLGVGLIIDRFKLCYTHVLQTKEFKGQEDNQTFGSITLAFTY
ncbi:lipid A deacylase LpxR family protein [Desulfobacula sp.]|uniref:lipid A deacylase LpxR family protein n=1 Tax=Desulfobacula sp. TaxID=2593537 RepID=UPI0026332BF9|nr:lipid A deacylase LpxR family protein [Desulfobacula sp.]